MGYIRLPPQIVHSSDKRGLFVRQTGPSASYVVVVTKECVAGGATKGINIRGSIGSLPFRPIRRIGGAGRRGSENASRPNFQMVTNSQIGPIPCTGQWQELEVLTPTSVVRTIDSGQFNPRSGSPTSTVQLAGSLYLRQKPSHGDATGYGDGWTVLQSSDIKRVDGKALRASPDGNNNVQFGVRPPIALGSTAPCYPIAWVAPLTVPATWQIVLRYIGDIGDSFVLFLSGP
jgi:hypothetical protein